MMCFVTSLLIFHTYLVINNITTKEELKKSFRSPFNNPYTRKGLFGVHNSLLIFFPKLNIKTILDELSVNSKSTRNISSESNVIKGMIKDSSCKNMKSNLESEKGGSTSNSAKIVVNPHVLNQPNDNEIINEEKKELEYDNNSERRHFKNDEKDNRELVQESKNNLSVSDNVKNNLKRTKMRTITCTSRKENHNNQKSSLIYDKTSSLNFTDMNIESSINDNSAIIKDKYYTEISQHQIQIKMGDSNIQEKESAFSGINFLNRPPVLAVSNPFKQSDVQISNENQMKGHLNYKRDSLNENNNSGISIPDERFSTAKVDHFIPNSSMFMSVHGRLEDLRNDLSLQNNK